MNVQVLDDVVCWLFLLLAQVYFGMLDALLAAEELPEEYRNRCQVYNWKYIFVLKSSRLSFAFKTTEFYLS